jgi:hypothetical protein
MENKKVKLRTLEKRVEDNKNMKRAYISLNTSL